MVVPSPVQVCGGGRPLSQDVSWIRLRFSSSGTQQVPVVPISVSSADLLVLEAVGGAWSGALRLVVAWVASETECSAVWVLSIGLPIAQRISFTLHMENARAIPARAPELGAPHVKLGLLVLAESEGLGELVRSWSVVGFSCPLLGVLEPAASCTVFVLLRGKVFGAWELLRDARGRSLVLEGDGSFSPNA